MAQQKQPTSNGLAPSPTDVLPENIYVTQETTSTREAKIYDATTGQQITRVKKVQITADANTDETYIDVTSAPHHLQGDHQMHRYTVKKLTVEAGNVQEID